MRSAHDNLVTVVSASRRLEDTRGTRALNEARSLLEIALADGKVETVCEPLLNEFAMFLQDHVAGRQARARGCAGLIGN